MATNKNEEKQTEALGFVVIEERKEDTSHTYCSQGLRMGMRRAKGLIMRQSQYLGHFKTQNKALKVKVICIRLHCF